MHNHGKEGGGRKGWRKEGRKKGDNFYPRACENLTSVCIDNYEYTAKKKATFNILSH